MRSSFDGVWSYFVRQSVFVHNFELATRNIIKVYMNIIPQQQDGGDVLCSVQWLMCAVLSAMVMCAGLRRSDFHLHPCAQADAMSCLVLLPLPR